MRAGIISPDKNADMRVRAPLSLVVAKCVEQFLLHSQTYKVRPTGPRDVHFAPNSTNPSAQGDHSTPLERGCKRLLLCINSARACDVFMVMKRCAGKRAIIPPSYAVQTHLQHLHRAPAENGENFHHEYTARFEQHCIGIVDAEMLFPRPAHG